jgi:hypothetical protein
MNAGENLEWANQTIVHPIGLTAALVGIGCALMVRRPLAVLPLLVLLCIVPPAQRIAIFGLDLTIARIVVLAG